MNVILIQKIFNILEGFRRKVKKKKQTKSLSLLKLFSTVFQLCETAAKQ